MTALIVTSNIGTDTENISAGFTAEFMERPDGYKGLTKAYGFDFADEPKQMDPGLMYKACADGAVDVICAFATDGRIEAYDLITLKDDKAFFPPYHAAPVVRADTLEEFPRLKETLNKLAGTIDSTTMRQLNYQVDREKQPRKASVVAKDFLIRKGLIDANSPAANAEPKGTIRIGGKDFTEQNILGEIMAELISGSMNVNVERKLYLGGTMVCFNALKSGDLDVYPEYTGTGLLSILDKKMEDPNSIYETVKKDFKESWNLVWLEPFGFNNTYTLAMPAKKADKLNIKTISDLAEYINKQSVNRSATNLE